MGVTLKMKRIVISNVLLVFVILFYWQFNANLFSFIHFYPAQSFFTRMDYLWMFGICFVIEIVMLYILYIIVRNHNDVNFRKILVIENGILLAVDSLVAIVYVYTVFNPPPPLIGYLEYNKPYTILVLFYIFEVVGLGYYSFKLIK